LQEAQLSKLRFLGLKDFKILQHQIIECGLYTPLQAGTNEATFPLQPGKSFSLLF